MYINAIQIENFRAVGEINLYVAWKKFRYYCLIWVIIGREVGDVNREYDFFMLKSNFLDSLCSDY